MKKLKLSISIGKENVMAVSKPTHYAKGIDTIKRAEANLTVNECIAIAKFNIDKYTWREKNQDLADCDKAMVYLKWRIKLLKRKAMIAIDKAVQKAGNTTK